MNGLVNDPLFGVLIALIILSLFVSQFGKRRRPRNYERQQKRSWNYERQPKRSRHSENELTDFPYQLQRNFLTAAELHFLQSLRKVVNSKAVICSKVRLGDVFVVQVDDNSKFVGYSNKINRKHIDFLLCDYVTMQPLVGLELDDKSHEREDRRERDAFVDQVFAAANLPLLHVTAKRTYSEAELTAQLSPYLDSVPTPVAANAVPQTQPKIELIAVPKSTAPAARQIDSKTPPCPECGQKMVLRTVKTGSRAGAKFWGCSTYPQCQGMLRVKE